MCCVLRNIKYSYFTTLILFFSDLSDRQTYGAEHSTLFNPLHKALRRNMSGSIFNEQPKMIKPQYVGRSFVGGDFSQMLGLARRQNPQRPMQAIFGKPRTTQLYKRTTPRFISQPDYCDYIARPCMHTYVTGKICARTLKYFYETFDNYCMMEYVNCRENYEIWQMVYTGACFNPAVISDYIHYPYHDDFFMDMYYVVDDRIV